jgi:hypothetical protein
MDRCPARSEDGGDGPSFFFPVVAYGRIDAYPLGRGTGHLRCVAVEHGDPQHEDRDTWSAIDGVENELQSGEALVTGR